jgi:Fe-S cluster biogenesis protein NfuA
MDQAIKITANLDPHRAEVCNLELDHPLYPNGSAYFADRASAQGSGLAEKLFALEGLTTVRIAGHGVTVTKQDGVDWRIEAKRIADIIRDHLRTGQPAVSEAYEARRSPDRKLRAKVQGLFDTEINPAVAEHGGHVELIDVKDRSVYIRMGGGCHGCGMANVTLRQGIERMIRQRIPEVAEIVDTTDHAAGTSPYYAP